MLSHLPSARKSANITALHKKGAKTDPYNYRPISLLTIISKVMESIIASDIKCPMTRKSTEISFIHVLEEFFIVISDLTIFFHNTHSVKCKIKKTNLFGNAPKNYPERGVTHMTSRTGRQRLHVNYSGWWST